MKTYAHHTAAGTTSAVMRHRPRLHWGIVAALLSASIVTAPLNAAPPDRPSIGVPTTAYARGGVVTAALPEASDAGIQMLEDGGNAIDAAAAVAFALNVVEPVNSGMGGGGFMMIYIAAEKKVVVVDTREKAPAAAFPTMFAGEAGRGTTTGRSVGVPGMIRGLELALNNWGSMPFAHVIEPARVLAENGFNVSTRLAALITSGRLSNEPANPAYQVARNVFRPGGVPLAAGALLKQPDLAKTLKILQEQGPSAFYTGPIAEAIVATQLATRSGNPPLPGLMTVADLAAYQAIVRQPLEATYRGYRILGTPPPSSGGLCVLHMLKLLERFPMGNTAQNYGFGQVRSLNVEIEALRLCFADRAIWMGDDDFVHVPVSGFLSSSYIAQRSALINPDARRSNATLVAGDPRPFDMAALPKGSKKVRLARAPSDAHENIHTTHFSIVDRWGNAVSYTNTIESDWGTGLMVPGYGFMLNNELTDFNLTPTFNPSPMNFNPGANDVAANKRPRSSMTPIMILKGDTFLAATGSPGGATIIGTVFQMALNLIDQKMVIQDAVNAARISVTSATGAVSRETSAVYVPGIPASTISILQAAPYGHSFATASDIGSAQTVVVDQRSRFQYGAADFRRIGGVSTIP